MIVLTDGKENREDYVEHVKEAIHKDNPNLKIFCVGIGPPLELGPTKNEGVEVEKLNAICKETGGLFMLCEHRSGDL